ncbi:MAG: hypothetical protein DDT19_02690 [Syntrophomonadaceae bacterium]|nr:hypothetical protein [Bacillota bacterium]
MAFGNKKTRVVEAVRLSELADVKITSPVASHYLRFDGANWRNVLVGAGDLPVGTIRGLGGAQILSLSTPGTPTITPHGVVGTTTWGYRITARSSVGETLASTAGTTTTGNATLSTTNFNRITWSAVAGAVDYRVYRTTAGGTPSTTGLIGTTTLLFFDDTGLAASGAVPTIDSSGNVGIGTASPTGQFTISRNNANHPLVNFDAHFVLENPNTSGQTLFTFSMSGTPVGGVRGDHVGNFNWHAIGSQGHQFYNSLDISSPILGMSASGLVVGGVAGATARQRLDIIGNAIISGNLGIGLTVPTTLLDINSDTLRLRTARTPATAGAAGNTGDICWDANFLYVCVATNVWRRASLAAW